MKSQRRKKESVKVSIVFVGCLIPRLYDVYNHCLGRRNNQRDGQPKGARNVENGNTEGHENRQPREKEDGNRRNQRSRREPGAKREGKKNVPPEHREDGDEHWVWWNNVLISLWSFRRTDRWCSTAVKTSKRRSNQPPSLPPSNQLRVRPDPCLMPIWSESKRQNLLHQLSATRPSSFKPTIASKLRGKQEA